jgi:hypothetical protein
MRPMPQPWVNNNVQIVPVAVETRNQSGLDNFLGANGLALLAVGYLLGCGRRQQVFVPPQVWVIDGKVRS